MKVQNCEDCEFSRAAKGSGVVLLTCDHKDPPNRLIVEAKDYCDDFRRAREILDPDLAVALDRGAKLIPLSQGKFAIVDAEDYEMLSQYKWHVAKSHRTYYAQSRKNGKSIRMHRLILNAPRHLLVDHIDHNGLNNRKINIRLCTPAENARNRRPCRGSSSRYKGVSFDKKLNRYQVHIQINGKSIKIGIFKSEIDAAKAYDKKAFELFGEFAYLNFPEDYGLPRRIIAI